MGVQSGWYRSQGVARELESSERRDRSQQPHVVGIDDGGIRGVEVFLPDRATVEGLECAGTRAQIDETAQPDEAVKCVRLPELAEGRARRAALDSR